MRGPDGRNIVTAMMADHVESETASRKEIVIEVKPEHVTHIVQMLAETHPPQRVLDDVAARLPEALQTIVDAIFVDSNTGKIRSSFIRITQESVTRAMRRFSDKKLDAIAETFMDRMLTQLVEQEIANECAAGMSEAIRKDMSEFVQTEARERVRAKLEKRTDEIADAILKGALK
jgi:signal recognition particle GTPase